MKRLLSRLLRLFQRLTWPAPHTRNNRPLMVVLAPGVTDPRPALFVLEAGLGSRFIPADSDAALMLLQSVGDKYDVGFSQ